MAKLAIFSAKPKVLLRLLFPLIFFLFPFSFCLLASGIIFCIYDYCPEDAGDLIGFLKKGFPITLRR